MDQDEIDRIVVEATERNAKRVEAENLARHGGVTETVYDDIPPLEDGWNVLKGDF